MFGPYRDLLKHSGVYGIGQVLSRLTSFLMLPVYTRFLRPSDYGCLAILDVTLAFLGILIGSGVAAAVTRHHFDAATDRERDSVWWTGWIFVAAAATMIILPVWAGRSSLANLLLGPDYPEGALYFSLALMTLWFVTINRVTDAYFRIRKWSGLFVALSLLRLMFNMVINVLLLRAGWGILGVLTGNLLAAVIFTSVKFCILFTSLGSYRFDIPLTRKLCSFGVPIIVTGLLSLGIHQADRYFLRVYLDMHDVGIYSIAYSICQGVNTILLLSFSSIWGVAIYEIAETPNSRKVFAGVFQYYTDGLMVVMLGLSLFAKPLMTLVATPDYIVATALVPILALGFLLFSLDEHFRVPALLHKQTAKLLPAFVAAVIVNIVSNVLLIPTFGTEGAAWSSVLTYFVLSGLALLLNRRIERIDYPLLRFAFVLLTVVASVTACGALEHYLTSTTQILLLHLLLWLAWCAILIGRPLLRHWKHFAGGGAVSTVPLPGD